MDGDRIQLPVAAPGATDQVRGAVLWTTLLILLILWLLGVLLGAGHWIHAFPVAMACLLAYRLFVPRRRRW